MHGVKKYLRNLAIVLPVVLIVSLTLNFLIYGNKDEVSTDLGSAVINHKVAELKVGDRLSADVWNGEEYTFNEKKLKIEPMLYRTIRIGTDIEDVIKTFDLRPGYAKVNREIATKEHDGTTDIVDEPYKDLSFFESESVLDAYLVFGYKKVSGKWRMITYEELEDNKADIVYSIDFLGESLLDDNSPVEVKQVIGFAVERFK